MLILTRGIGQSIIIDEGKIKITVVDFGRNPDGGRRVRIGIEAPKEIRVDREEVHELREREKWDKKEV